MGIHLRFISFIADCSNRLFHVKGLDILSGHFITDDFRVGHEHEQLILMQIYHMILSHRHIGGRFCYSHDLVKLSTGYCLNPVWFLSTGKNIC